MQLVGLKFNGITMRASTWTSLIILVFILAVQLPGECQDWNRFRGPNGTGVVADAKLPSEWKKAKWEINLAGSGNSSPVAWGDHVFVTSCDMTTAAVTVECFHLVDGKRAWAKTFESKPYHLHDRNAFAASTPAVDRDHVYLSMANPDQTILVALSHEGKEVWRRDFGRWISSHGFAHSPIVHEDIVVFCDSQSNQPDSNGVEPGFSRMIGIDRMTGKDVWTTALTTRRSCYSVPCVWKDSAGAAQLVNCNTGDGFYSIDPANGQKKWSALPFKMRTVASILAVENLLIGSCGSGGGGNYLVAFKPDDRSTGKPTKAAYRVRQANYVPCPVAVNGLLFVFNDKGIGQCVDLKTGKSNWKKRLPGAFSSSPVANEQHIYLVAEDGKGLVVEASRDFNIVSKFDLGEATKATPMIYKDKLYFRTLTKLICVSE